MTTDPSSERTSGPAGFATARVAPGATAAYLERYRASLVDAPAFWGDVARDVVRWRRPFSHPLDWDPPHAKWFPEGTLNVAENCLDRHLDGPSGDRVAYHWEGEDGARRKLTYAQLHAEVEKLAGALAARGFSSNDFAAVYLPMVPELPVTMLALARLGIPFTVVFSGFSASALAERIQHLGARLLITADGGYRRGAVVPLKQIADEALRSAPTVRDVVVVRRTGTEVTMTPGRDLEYAELVRAAPKPPPMEAFPSDHLLYLLYSSGTTGRPKGIAHGTGGYLVHVTATMRWIFGLRPDDVFWCAADIGWVTGHSYIVFGPLANGATSLLYEGAFDHPTPDRLYAIAERYRATILYTSPTALRALRRNGDDLPARHDLSSLRLLGTVGEAINPSVWQWYHDVIGRGRCPIVDTWWQTETGGAMVGGAMGVAAVPAKPGSATFPLLGIDADVVDERGASTRPGEKGLAVVRRPWPGMLLTLYREEERYRAAYWSRFPGLYYAGDYAFRDEDGYFWFLGRADEVLKVAGHRLGTIEIEDALLLHPAVAEAAVCGQADEIRGETPVAFVVLRAGATASDRLASEIADVVSDRIGKIARPTAIHFVARLPKTRSGKIMRRVVKAVADGRTDVGDVTTLEDGASVEEIREALQSLSGQLGGAPASAP